MRTVVMLCRQSLTVRTEVGIVANRTLVSISDNESVGTFTSTQRSVTMYAVVAFEALRDWWNSLPERDKSMPRVGTGRILNASRAIVPVGAVYTFVTNAANLLYHFSRCQEREKGG